MNRWIKISSSILCTLLSILLLKPSVAAEFPSREGYGGKLSIPSFAFSWLDNKAIFQAGDVATIKVKLLDSSSIEKKFESNRYLMSFSLSVSGKRGNSSYISGVFQYLDGDPSFWNITFTPIMLGDFTMVVSEDNFGITDSSLHFTVTAGHMHPSVCVASWMDQNEFVAGTKAYILVLPKDAFGNNISKEIDRPGKEYWRLSASYENGSAVELLDFRYSGWNKYGYLSLEFVPTIAGDLSVYVYGDNKTLRGCPLPFTVKPGPLDMTNSLGKWRYGSNFLQIFSRLEIVIHLRDSFGNLVPAFHSLDARVVERISNLSVPVADFFFQEVSKGIQLLSFVVSEPGEFTLAIFDAKLNESFATLMYGYTVFIGYCNGSNSLVNGSGLANSVAGRMSSFTVFLKDRYHNPSPVEAERLYVQIVIRNGTVHLHPFIFPLRNISEFGPVSGQIYSANGLAGFVPALPGNDNQTIIGNPKTIASDFNVAYTPQRSGDYEIWVLSGNIPLNNGLPFLMQVSPGIVSMSLSRVVRFSPTVKRFAKNEVLVQLVDSFSNPIVSYQSKLNFQIEFTNSSSFARWVFVDNKDGSYLGYYLARELGSYNICISFEDKHVTPCPFEVHVYDSEYFSEAHNDSVSVWEDESVVFDVLSNDYVAGGHADLLESTTPLHGSLLQYGKMFRYTPQKGFFGNDSFSYTISDINRNFVNATVFIYVLCKPPQFVSLPVRLHVTEDVVSPKFGGFPGFEIIYSDIAENISVTVRAQSGTVFLAPLSMQLQQSLDSLFSVSRGGRTGKDLIITGHVEEINVALQLIKYLGNENFYGNDIISLYAMNKNGIQDAHLPVFVAPINDPPIIHAPMSIVLRGRESSDKYQIFDKQRDVYEFSVIEPDIFSFPGNKSHFMLTFSLEVNYGTLSLVLPVSLIGTVELKIESSNHWQSLQTYVTISNTFVVKGKGIRFRGTVGDCNNAMQRLFYQGESQDAILTISINDMGNYGCYPDSIQMMSSPLSTEVTVNLIRRRVISLNRSFLVGSAMTIEIFMMLLLGAMLLFFICKCMNALHRDTKDNVDDAIRPSEETSKDRNMDIVPSQNVAHTSGRSTVFSFKTQESNFRQRSRRRFQI
ncbi:protein GAMETE EXPRESSED 2 [Typha latifolia]|uniref:protein GAMETE EXPRESSED 2 n=1 Tax=Typha latifolia TaxID=4733 RepID=UPI003C2ED1EB